MPLVSFYTPWKHHKASGFMIFSESAERDTRHEMELVFFGFRQILVVTRPKLNVYEHFMNVLWYVQSI